MAIIIYDKKNIVVTSLHIFITFSINYSAPQLQCMIIDFLKLFCVFFGSDYQVDIQNPVKHLRLNI